jgi:hypothetical protein
MQLHGTLWNHASSVITKQSFDSGGTEKKTPAPGLNRYMQNSNISESGL